MYRMTYPGDIFAELNRMQSEVDRLFGQVPSIRGMGGNRYPPLNVGGTPKSVEIYAFAPGVDPASIEVNIERGVLTITGQRQTALPTDSQGSTLHANERFVGTFSRAVSLPDDLDTNQVTAKYNDGVLHVSVKRRESSQPRRVQIQG